MRVGVGVGILKGLGEILAGSHEAAAEDYEFVPEFGPEAVLACVAIKVPHFGEDLEALAHKAVFGDFEIDSGVQVCAVLTTGIGCIVAEVCGAVAGREEEASLVGFHGYALL